jgi:glycerophosphoryl diester phosphodiesterase
MSKTGDDDGGDDVIHLLPGMVMVADGATGLSDRRIRGKTPGRFAADTVSAALGDSEMPDITLRTLTDRLSEHLAWSILDTLGGETADPRTTYAFVAYNARRREIWRVGDCQFLIDGRGYGAQRGIDSVTGEARAAMLRCHIHQGRDIESLMTDDPGRAFIEPLLAVQHHLRNVDAEDPYAYAGIDGRHVPDRYLEVFPVPEGTREIVMASDGYPALHPTLAETERTLAEMLAEDPLCIEFEPQTKGLRPGQVSFDDRSYVRLRLTG